MGILCTYNTDKGLWKEKNQDSLCIKVAETPIGTIAMAVLCDGMGGLNNGEIASAIAVQTYSNWFEKELSTLLQPFSLEQIRLQMEQQMQNANEQIIAYGREHGIRLGTTCSVLLLIHHYFYIVVHIGDTRIYKMRGDITALTIDHTLVEHEIALGHITKNEARTDSRRNILLQCLGVKHNICPETCIGETENDSVYLLCSDGFYHKSTYQDYCQLLSNQLRSEEKLLLVVKQLIRKCRERNEKDDITAIVIKINA